MSRWVPLVVARLRRKISKFHVFEGREHEKMILITFSFSELRYRLLEFHSWPEKLASIWRIERDGIHFLCDVFATVTVVDAKAL